MKLLQKILDNMIHYIHMIISLQYQVVSILEKEDEDRNQKEIIPVVTAMSDLCNHLDCEGQQFTQVQCWFDKICRERSADDSSVVKCIFNALLTLSSRQKSCVTLLRDIAQDMHTYLGDIDQEVEMEEETNFAMV